MKRINQNILLLIDSLNYLKKIYNLLIVNKTGDFTLKGKRKMALVSINNNSRFTLKQNNYSNI
jgi:hypothetical protein